jgi:hypothetical protein
MKKTSMTRIAALWAGALLVTAACGDYVVPNFNNESLDALVENPNPIRIATASSRRPQRFDRRSAEQGRPGS